MAEKDTSSGARDRRRAGAPMRLKVRPRTLFLVMAAIILMVAIVVGGAVLRPKTIASSKTADSKPAPALTVTATLPGQAEWPATLNASGVVAPWHESSIDTQIGNYRLVEVRVDVGDRVRKGQVLARFDQDFLRADEAQLAARFEQAAIDRDRALRLRATGATSEQAAQQLVTNAKVAAADLARKRLELRDTEILATDDGIISARSATLGAVVPAGEELFRLIRQERLEWRGELTPAQLSQVRTGQEIRLELPDGSNALATVRQIAPTLDSRSRLGLIYADLRPGSAARAGMYANGSIELARSPALVVPSESVVIRDGRSQVLILSDSTGSPTVRLRHVTIGRRRGGDIEVVQGLAAGEQVVVRGAGFLNDGDLVRLAPASTIAGEVNP